MMLRKLVAIAACALAGGCSVLDSSRAIGPLDANAKWVMLPIANHTETPQAGLRAEAIAEGLLRAKGVKQLVRYPAQMSAESSFEPSERKIQGEAQAWAKLQGAQYGISGAVDEWKYKVGVDGEPAVGMALQIVDVQSGAVVWSAVGGQSGWSREALAAVAQKLIRGMLRDAPIQ